MYFSTIIATALIAASTMATPAMKLERNPPKKEQVCPFNLPDPQCCATNVLGIADLNCAARTSYLPPYSQLPSFRFIRPNSVEPVANSCSPIAPKVPENEADFFMTCSSIGQQAQCCLLPIVRLSSRPFATIQRILLTYSIQAGQALVCEEPSSM